MKKHVFSSFVKGGLDKKTTLCYISIVNTMLYIEEVESVIQQISDTELEIMKIVWGNPEKVTLFPYIMDGLAARGKPCQKNTPVKTGEQELFER